MSSVRVEIDTERIATIWLDAPGKRVNTLSRQMWGDLSAAIDQLERDKPAGVVIRSAKRGTFVVGADLFEIREMTDEQFDDYIRKGQEILARIENLPMPTLAAINGDCLGGGLELALACTVYIAMDTDAAIGLPETRLGLIPGWGGTVRLSRLIGRNAVELISEAKLLKPSEAQSLHVVDDLLSPGEFESLVHRLMVDLIDRPFPRNRVRFGHPRDFEPVLANADSSTPAKARLIEVIREGIMHGPQAGFDAERRAITELRNTPECRELMNQFFARQAKKRDQPM
jgi:3-hydroxyacyl-CoA dehydrogenase / enoyl-CoA hydratase / 3-hydroxybutyryl-CoA epimerase